MAIGKPNIYVVSLNHTKGEQCIRLNGESQLYHGAICCRIRCFPRRWDWVSPHGQVWSVHWRTCNLWTQSWNQYLYLLYFVTYINDHCRTHDTCKPMRSLTWSQVTCFPLKTPFQILYTPGNQSDDNNISVWLILQYIPSGNTCINT